MQLGFFDIEDKYEKLTKLGDPLARINELIDFTMFEDIYYKAFPINDQPTEKNPKNAGRKPIPASVIIRTIFLKRLYGLSNEQTEYQITDRHSFQRFVGIDANKSAPDFTTIWKRENKLSKLGYVDLMFKRFDQFLNERGFMANGGAIVDASIVEVPKQRNTREENKQIKKGKVPKSIKKNRHKRSQKDVDARWTKKHGVNYYLRLCQNLFQQAQQQTGHRFHRFQYIQLLVQVNLIQPTKSPTLNNIQLYLCR